MGDSHSKSFFGQNAGLILSSSSKIDPFFFIRCIKKKPDGNWEKPSKGEGKVIKFSLDEAVMILQVLNRKLLNWKSYHTYKDNKTPLSFSWEDEKAKTLWINIANYSKMFNFAQAENLRLLITHLLDEKIEFATISQSKSKNKTIKNKGYSGNFNPPNGIIEFEEDFTNDMFEEMDSNSFNENQFENSPQSNNNKSSEKLSQIMGSLKGETAKAVLINFNSGQELWIPKSTIHSEYQSEKNMNQKFLIDNWILKKNKILS